MSQATQNPFQSSVIDRLISFIIAALLVSISPLYFGSLAQVLPYLSR